MATLHRDPRLQEGVNCRRTELASSTRKQRNPEPRRFGVFRCRETSHFLVVLTARFSNLKTRGVTARDITIRNLDPTNGFIQTQGRLDDNQIQQLASAYRGGATINRVAKSFGISRTTVMRHLDAAGVKTRYRVAALKESTIQETIELYTAGNSVASIAIKLDLTAYIVTRELRRADIPIRPRGFQSKPKHP